MTNEFMTDDSSRGKGRWGVRVVLARFAWVFTGILLSVFFFVDPLDMHSIDGWFRGVMDGDSSETSALEGEREVLFYRNPMDPTITSPVPAEDDMGMAYIPVYAEDGGSSSGEGEILFYRNPMDPTISSPVPTEDNMGMAYIPVYAEEPAGSSSGTGEILFYRNPMDPTITSPVPAEDDMGMAYIPVYADAGGESSADGPVVRIDAATVQNMNVQFERAERNDITHHIRTVGYFEYDQERMVSITTKYSGWIEKVHVNYVGEKVSQGQPLFEIYSPELVQTEQELLSALGYARQMAGTPEDVRVRAENLVAAARTRLSYWDITPEQIERLEQEGRVVRTLTVTAPSSGVVMMRMPGLEGMSVKPGMELFHIAGVQSLWLNVEVFEGQLAFVDVGSRADVSLSYFPGTDFAGVVRFIAPEVSEKTRSISLLLEVPNANGKLKAGMFATVLFEPVIRRQAVTVPRLAVIRTGERDVVILQREPGRFVPRVVRVGHEGLISTEILEGVEEGDLVVTSGQFLIDSESSLQAAIQKMIEARSLEATQSKAAPSAEESGASAHEGAGHAQ